MLVLLLHMNSFSYLRYLVFALASILISNILSLLSISKKYPIVTEISNVVTTENTKEIIKLSHICMIAISDIATTVAMRIHGINI